MSILDRILRAGEGKKLKALKASSPTSTRSSRRSQKLSDDELRGKTVEFRERLANGADARRHR